MLKNAMTAVFLTALALTPLAVRAETLTAAGSTALEPLVKQNGREFQQHGHKNAAILVSGGGSGMGVKKVAARQVTFGNSDVPASGHPELVDHRVAIIGFAVVVNPKSGVTNLTKTQIRDIFSGRIKSWKKLGGKDEPVIIINRPAGSGTRAVFISTMMEGAKLDEGTSEDRTETVVAKVKSTPGAISYAALSGTRNQGVTLLSIDGVEPTDQNIENENYPIWSYEHIYTNGKPSPEAAAFLDFIAENVSLLHKLGYIGIKEMKSSGIR